MLRIERTADGQGRVFRLVGELDGGTTRQFERIVAGPIGDGGDVTLDLGDLTVCDVAGVESLTVLRPPRASPAVGCSSARRARRSSAVLEEGNLEVGTSQ